VASVCFATGRPTVLLVDDDTAVRQFARRILVEHEYAVIQAGDGVEALELLNTGTTPDLLLTDIIMPRMNGLMLAEWVAQQRPEIRILYISGYAEASILTAKRSGSTILQKPFTAERLIVAVRDALSSKIRAVGDATL
jgi:two-component system, cell cycle sensor histidine kinase and response regulator CckA